MSARFGLHLTFLKPDQKEYFLIIEKMLEKENIVFNQEEEVRRWALKHLKMNETGNNLNDKEGNGEIKFNDE